MPKKTIWVYILGGFVGLAPAKASSAEPGQPYEECQGADEQILQKELYRVTEQALILDRQQIGQLVEKQWLKSNVDEAVDIAAASAVSKISGQEDYVSRLWSTWSPVKAQELAEKVAQETFSASSFMQAMNDYVQGISEELSREVEAASERSASVALKCIHTYLRHQHHENVVELFDASLQKGLEQTGLSVSPTVTPVGVGDHTKALAGVGIVIGSYISRRVVRQFVAKLTSRIAGRIAGRALGRGAASLVPMVGWALGAGMIVWELMDGGKGAFPQIQAALTSEASKAQIRQQVAEAAEKELRNELPRLSEEIAGELYAKWLRLKTQIRQLLDLAQKNDKFRELLRSHPPEQFTRLSNQVDIVEEIMGEVELTNTIEDGRFERLLQLPESALEIVRVTRSISEVFRWAGFAGENFAKVVELEVYRYRSSGELSKADVELLIGLDSPAQVAKLLMLSRPMSKTLLRIPPDFLERFLQLYSAEQLSWIAKYADALPEKSRNFFLSNLYQRPGKLTAFSSEKMINETATKQETLSVLQFVFSDVSVVGLWDDLRRLAQGDVTISLLTAKYRDYGLHAMVIGGSFGVFLVLFLRRRR